MACGLIFFFVQPSGVWSEVSPVIPGHALRLGKKNRKRNKKRQKRKEVFLLLPQATRCV
jgi:hypothetical protein